jgi:adenosine deaminase
VRETLLAQLPKAELHIHIEGSLEPEMTFDLARRHQVTLAYDAVDDLRSAYDFGNLQDFLDLYYLGMSVLIDEQGFYDLTMAYLRRAAADKVTYAEIFFDPQAHTSRGIAFETALNGIHRALSEGQATLGVTGKIIMCILRHLDEDDALHTLDQALGHKDKIIGIGLDSSELGHPPTKFKNVFARAREEGFKLTAHAGEEGPADYIWQSLDVLGVDRIDHGNNAKDDAALMQRLADDRMALTMCPLSNQRLRSVPDLADHPIRRMLEAGLLVTVNSDDPSYFGGYMNDNFRALDSALNLTDDEATAIARNGFVAAFMTDAERQAALNAFDDATGT